jgi:hypothetical protein
MGQGHFEGAKRKEAMPMKNERNGQKDLLILEGGGIYPLSAHHPSISTSTPFPVQ